MKPEKVLIVDDSKMMHRMYEVMLRQYPLVFATNKREALEMVETREDIDLVLLDLHMPSMNALEFLQELRARELGNRLRVMLVSTEDRAEDVARGMELGAHNAITKPFQAEHLLDRIARLD